MKRKRIAIDIRPMAPGRGGTGGGVWRYSKTLLEQLDELVSPDGPELVVFAHSSHALTFRNISVIATGDFLHPKVDRFIWVHWKLPRLCRRHRVDLLHKLATEVPLDQRGFLVVVTIHDFMAEFQSERVRDGQGTFLDRLRREYFSSLARFALRRSEVSIFPTGAVRDEAANRYGESSTSSRAVIPNGVEQLGCRARGQRGPGRFTWIVVASFSPHKGHLEVLNALQELGSRFAPEEAVRVIFRGHVVDHLYYEQVKSAATRLPPNVALEFTSFSSQASSNDLYDEADGLLLLSHYEGFGLPPMEAQARRLPVIVSDIPVFQETLGDGALFVAADDPVSVSAAMVRVMREPDLRSSLGDKGCRNAAAFTWSRTAAETWDIYARVLGRTRGGC